MPELKHNFTGGKMNKDLDERLVPNGQYRDALNIQVRTTDGDSQGVGNAGSVQNIQGNTSIAEAYLTKGYNYSSDTNTTRFVGSIANERNDVAYFFGAAPTPENWIRDIVSPQNNLNLISSNQIDEEDYAPITTLQILLNNIPNLNPEISEALGAGESFNPNTNYLHAQLQNLYFQQISSTPLKVWIDSIVEVNAKSETGKNIFIDKFAVTGRWLDVIGSNPTEESSLTSGITELNVIDGSIYRIGMVVRLIGNDFSDLFFKNGTDSSDGVGVEIVNIQGNVLSLATAQDVSLYDLAIDENPILEWNSAFIFEYPERVLEFDPFKLITSINIIDDLLFWTDGYNEPKKINIKRCAAGTSNSNQIIPSHTTLQVYDNEEGESDLTTVENMEWSLITSDIKKEHITVIREAPRTAPTLLMRDTVRNGQINFNIEYSFIDGESYTPAFPQTGDERVIEFPENYDIQVGDILKFTSADNLIDPVIITVRVLEIEGQNVAGDVHVEIITVDPELAVYNTQVWLVELEQEDPIFETKFGRVGYRYKYEDGEYSTFSPWSELAFFPGDFSYTPSQGFNNGMGNQLRYLVIKNFIPHDSVRPNDVRSVDLLWKTTDDQNVYIIKTITRGRSREWRGFENPINQDYGKAVITSEMINKVLSTDQLFRSWDNVPKSATTQEITANRLVYGNYKQGYNINKDVSLLQNVISNPVSFPSPQKSVKSIRSYKWGIVLGDKYGRETSVLVDGYESGTNQSITGDITIDKSLSTFANKFRLQQQWEFTPNSILQWADYVKYYVKETSNEYYNLVLDRWYDSGDGNIWLAFPSVDRNKVDEETYLILKNQHGSQVPVQEKARYKILAITGDAPDFIKTRQKIYDRVEIDQLGIYGIGAGDETGGLNLGEITDGIPDNLIEKTSIRTSFGNWDTIGITHEDIKGTLKVRIVGVQDYYNIEAFSPLREVSRIHKGTAAGGRSGVDISKTYTNAEVNMVNKLNALLPEDEVQLSVAAVDDDNDANVQNYIKYYMEIVDEVVENRPQFDGRFFVKIEKDGTIEEQVLNQAGSNGLDYIEDGDPFAVAFISNSQNNPAQYGDQGGYGGDSWDSYADGAPFTNSTIDAKQSDSTLDGNLKISMGIEPSGDNEYSPSRWPFLPSPGSNRTNPWNSTYWGEINWNNVYNRHTDAVSNFGPGLPEETENFWYWWLEQGEGNNPARTTNIFLDDAPAFDNFYWRTTALSISFNDDPEYFQLGLNTAYEALSWLDFDINSYYIGAKGSYTFPPNNRLGGGSLPDGFTFNNTGILGYSENLYKANGSGLLVGDIEGFASFSGGQLDGQSCVSYKPAGLSEGEANNGELGQMTFSMIGTDQGFGNGPEAIFKQKMQTVGNYFRFVEDPFQTVYKIIEIRAKVPNRFSGDLQDGNWGEFVTEFADVTGPVSIDSINFPASSLVSERNRHSIVVRFARCEDGAELPFTGIQTDEWDPRGHVKHNGLGNFTIQFLNRTNEGQLLEDEILTEGACFETEPKEDLDVDIYYEASNAIPMVLKKDNIKSFLACYPYPSNASDVTIENRSLSTVDSNNNTILEPVPMIPWGAQYQTESGNSLYSITSPFVYTTIGNDCVNVKVDIGNGNAVDFAYFAQGYGDGDFEYEINGLIVGDILKFNNPNGSITRTKILDHVVPVDSTGTYTWDSNALDYDAYNSFDSYKPTKRFTLSGTFYTIDETNPDNPILVFEGTSWPNAITSDIKIGMEVTGDIFEKGTFIKNVFIPAGPNVDKQITLSRAVISNEDSSVTFTQTTGFYQIDTDVYKYAIDLPWFNCYSFGNGVESDRIRDDFNAPQINNGVKVSSTFLEYAEEHIGSGLIHSSELYNDTSSINGLNQFSMAQKITKNLNPVYGSIQRLKTRDTDVVVFSEDKVLKVLANKDAVFNADGNTNLTATNKVLGQAIPFAGDYGISKNPESLAVDNYRMYFTDKQRGSVLRLSQDGLTPISSVGMKAYFREYLPMCETLVGTFDIVNGEYNLKLGINEINENETICNEYGCTTVASPITISFNEGSKGWVSFKSFMHSCGVSVTGKYITAPTNKHESTNKIWKHYSDGARNEFYGGKFNSSIDVLINDQPDSVKSFKTMGYEGSKSRIIRNLQDNNHENITSSPGWYVQSIVTDLQKGKVPDFIKKESKFYNYIVGEETTVDDIDIADLSIQGIGYPVQIGETTSDSVTVESSTQTTSGEGTSSTGINPSEPTDSDDVETDIEIEDEDGETNETDGEEQPVALSIPVWDEVIAVPVVNNLGETRYSILGKVSGGSGNYSFVLRARYYNASFLGPDALPQGLDYTPLYEGNGSAPKNAWPTWPLNTGSLQGNQYVPLDFDWSFGEWDFASHTQFPIGLQLIPIADGSGTTGVEYDLFVLDNENPTELVIYGETIDVGYPYYAGENGQPTLSGTFNYDGILLNSLPTENIAIPGFPLSLPINIETFSGQPYFLNSETSYIPGGPPLYIGIGVVTNYFNYVINEINGVTGGMQLQDYINNNNINISIVDFETGQVVSGDAVVVESGIVFNNLATGTYELIIAWNNDIGTKFNQVFTLSDSDAQPFVLPVYNSLNTESLGLIQITQFPEGFSTNFVPPQEL